MVLEKTLESPLDCKEIKPVNPKGNHSQIFIGRTEAEAPILWPPDAKSYSLEKSLMLEKTDGERKGGSRGWDGWIASPTPWTCIWANSGRWWRTGTWCAAVHGVTKSQRRLNDWTRIRTTEGLNTASFTECSAQTGIWQIAHRSCYTLMEDEADFTTRYNDTKTSSCQAVASHLPGISRAYSQ